MQLTRSAMFVREQTRDVIFCIGAIAFGVTLPHLFHLFGLGPVFLPMFLPIILLALFSRPFSIITVSIVTPLLSTLVFGIPEITIAIMMIAQLATVGIALALLRTKHVKALWTVPTAILIERATTFVLASLIPQQIITAESVVNSYQGIVMLSVIGVLFARLYER